MAEMIFAPGVGVVRDKVVPHCGDCLQFDEEGYENPDPELPELRIRKTINYLSFKCWSCGAQWDSEPFETGEDAGVGPFILWHILALSMYIGVDVFLYIVSKSQDIFVLMLLFFPLIDIFMNSERMVL